MKTRCVMTWLCILFNYLATGWLCTTCRCNSIAAIMLIINTATALAAAFLTLQTYLGGNVFFFKTHWRFSNEKTNIYIGRGSVYSFDFLPYLRVSFYPRIEIEMGWLSAYCRFRYTPNYIRHYIREVKKGGITC